MTDPIQLLAALNDYLTVDRAMFLYFIYNAAVQALAKPIETDGRFYVWFYKFAHTLAANIRVVSERYPYDGAKERLSLTGSS